MTNLKTMTIEQLLAKIGEARNIDRLKDLKPVIEEELSVLEEWDFSGEIIYKMYGFAMSILVKDPSLMQHLNFKAAAGDQKKPVAIFEIPVIYGPKMRLKSLVELVEENPDFIQERIDDNHLNFFDNGRYFFEKANVPALLAFLKREDIWPLIKDNDLVKSVRALQRFDISYHDNKTSEAKTNALKELFPIETA
ncbi:hypothetical protein ACFOWA_19930 [Pedobacter lithocola]|uniref:Uncharacterized protein n=1 Tax=Pedobacter lithocola TaxID=1908239 RepID=A0ABV8PE88_9SPHI